MANKTKKVVKKAKRQATVGRNVVRNVSIVQAKKKGVHVNLIAKKHKITPMRVYQILRAA